MDQEYLREILRYEESTGKFYWLKEFKTGSVRVGDTAGCKNNRGYIVIRILRKLYRAHRLSFLYMEGKFPADMVDHINGVPSDNRWCNLRHSTSGKNQKNLKISKDNKSGVNGVSWCKNSSKWRAQIQVNGKRIHLGLFVDIEDADKSRRLAEQKYGFTIRREKGDGIHMLNMWRTSGKHSPRVWDGDNKIQR